MYDPAFYDVIKEGSLRSARVVVPFVVQVTRARRVVDVGCGEGWWLSEFAASGCYVEGLDGDYVDRTRLCIDPEQFSPIDLAHERVERSNSFDLVVSLEVAEHLPEGRADTFVADLCGLGDLVLFSAAIPGQGGNGHINEQWPDYWVERFRHHGFKPTAALRWLFWDHEDVENWYRQNLVLFATEYGIGRFRPQEQSWFTGPWGAVHRVVHPVLWDSRR